MSLVVVNADLCLRDGICVAECPSYLLEMRDGGCPTPVAWAEETCIDCGHCVAVCPVGALSLRTMMPEQCAEVRRELLPDSAQVSHLLRVRRSIRSFEPRSVPQGALARLIEDATYAPSGSNSQPVEWLVIHDTALVRRLAPLMLDWLRGNWSMPRYARIFNFAHERGLDMVCRGAPHMAIAHTPPGAVQQGLIAVTYLELAAFGAGLGACWCGFADAAIKGSPEIRALVGLPEGRVSAGVLLLGYPRYAYARVPLRKPARIAWR
jgi:nitroreductase/NAD-dependent dihydropyrimidine dehydrogenase PreA subunit